MPDTERRMKQNSGRNWSLACLFFNAFTCGLNCAIGSYWFALLGLSAAALMAWQLATYPTLR